MSTIRADLKLLMMFFNRKLSQSVYLNGLNDFELNINRLNLTLSKNMHVHVATYNTNGTWFSFTQDHWHSYPTLYAKRTTVYRDYLIGQTDTQHNNFDNIFQYLNTF